MLQSYSDLNDMHIDALREIGNIGAGNAASSLAMMLADQIDISVPTVRILEYERVMEELGGPEQMIVGLLLCLEGDVNGMIMFLLHQNFANKLVGSLLGEEPPEDGELDEMAYSALQEVANIMAASYVNAIASLTEFKIDITVPYRLYHQHFGPVLVRGYAGGDPERAGHPLRKHQRQDDFHRG